LSYVPNRGQAHYSAPHSTRRLPLRARKQTQEAKPEGGKTVGEASVGAWPTEDTRSRNPGERTPQARPPSHYFSVGAVASRQRSASALADRLRRTISRTAPATAASARIFFTKVAS